MVIKQTIESLSFMWREDTRLCLGYCLVFSGYEIIIDTIEIILKLFFIQHRWHIGYFQKKVNSMGNITIFVKSS